MWEVDQLNDNQILSNGPREPQVEVGLGGLAMIELEPTTTSGYAVIRVRYNERQSEEFKVWLAPAARDWILVGIAEGTAAYNKISGNMETADARPTAKKASSRMAAWPSSPRAASRAISC